MKGVFRFRLLRKSWQRLRQDPLAIWQALRPTCIDQYLYQGTANELPAGSLAKVPVRIERYDQQRTSGVDDVDRRMSADKCCYIAWVDHEAAHQSWLFQNTVLPAYFGFDSRVPVIGGCRTHDAFRGQRIYPEVLRHIARDSRRAPSGRVFVLVRIDNTASIRGIEAAGFQRLARLQAWRCLGLLVCKKMSQS